jgi:branched-chain amino acid transport system substrate-binding protein
MGMDMKKRWLANVSLIVVILLLFTACASNKASVDNKGPIVIGANLALTGPAGYLGQKMKEVFDLVVKQTNEKGGINGRKLEIKYYDDENKPEKAVQNVQKLIKKDRVKVILGPSTVTTTSAVQPIIDKNKILMFATTNAYQPPANSYAFNTSLKQPATHLIHHEWLKEKGIKKVGVIATTDSSGDLYTSIIKNQFDGKDGIHYYFERMAPDDVNVTSQLTRLKSKGIEAIIVIGIGSPSLIALKDIHQLGLNIPVLMTQLALSWEFPNQIKEFAPEQLYISGTPPMVYNQINDRNPLKPLMKKMAEDFKAAYNKEIDHVGAIGYDSIISVIKGMEMAGGDNPTKIKGDFETKFKDVALTTSVVNYTKEDHQGTNGNGIVLIRLIKDGTWKLELEPKFWEK